MFNSVDKALASQVVELLASLGQRPHLAEFQAHGYDKRVTAYAVEFTPVSIQPFRLERKATLVGAVPKNDIRARRRLIVSVEPGPDVETACIAVNSPTRTYLAGEKMIPTHNTQEKFWTYQEHSGQQWIYDTAPFVWEGPLSPNGAWVPQERGTYVGRPGGVCEGRPAALLIHMPSKGGPVELIELDLDYGAAVVRLAERVIGLRDQGKRAGGICPA